MSDSKLEHLGEAAIRVAGLRIWVHGRANPEAMDAWDGNWLTITAHCGEAGASVRVFGEILDLVSFQTWATELMQLYDRLEGEAVLTSHEPNLEARVQSIDRSGHLTLSVSITPNHMTQSHTFEFDLDQSYLPALAAQCQAVLTSYPIRDRAGRGV